MVDGKITINDREFEVSQTNNTITNTIHETNNGTLEGSKVWVDGNVNHVSEEEITLELYRSVNGGTPAKVDYADNQLVWTGDSFKFSGLKVYDTAGNVYSYSVKEAGVVNNQITINGRVFDVSQTDNTITNTIHETNNGTLEGSKVWVDGNVNHVSEEEITLELYRSVNGGTPAKVDYADNQLVWTGDSFKFSGLKVYDTAGNVYSYSVKEAGVVDGKITINDREFEVSQTNNTITNTITQDYVSVSGEKIWKVPTDVEIPESITVELFRDGEATGQITTASAVDWTYSFDNLPKYAVGEAVGEGEIADGHMYQYTVAELNVPDNFKSKVVEVGANQFNIINTYDRSADTEVHVQKRWIDFGTNVTTHSAITIELYQNNVLYDTVQLSDENDWNTTFVELPKYDANQQPFDYTVKEVAVAGYTTTILEVKDNEFVVTNTLMLGKPGEITVEKQTTGDKKPGNDVKFKFELQVQITRPEGTNVLFDAMALSELDLGDAASNLNDAMDAVQASAMLVTSSSTYQYLLTEKETEFATGATALMGVEYEGTTTSAIKLAVAPSELSENEYELQYNLTKNIVETLVDLSDEYRKYTLEDMLVALAGEIPLDREYGYAVAMDMNAVTWLIDASRGYSDLAALEPGAPATTTPSALQIFMNGSTSPSALTYVADGDYYAVDFWLANGEKAVFDIQATTGSAISYKIVETLDPATEKDYVGTSIFDSVNNQTTSGTAIGFVAYNENEPMSYLFTNNYANNPYIPPVDPVDPVDPGDDPDIEIEDPDVPLTDPEEPVIEIEDPDVPLIDMPGEEVEIDEPEVPLGDAPQTGDNSNTIPFVVLMLAAACGLVVTRRKLN